MRSLLLIDQALHSKMHVIHPRSPSLDCQEHIEGVQEGDLLDASSEYRRAIFKAKAAQPRRSGSCVSAFCANTPQRAFESSTTRLLATDFAFLTSSLYMCCCSLVLHDFQIDLLYQQTKQHLLAADLSKTNDTPSHGHLLSALSERFIRGISPIVITIMPRSEVSTYAPLPFHTIRALALTSTIIVFSILGYFCFQLKNDGFKLPWTLLVVCPTSLSVLAHVANILQMLAGSLLSFLHLVISYIFLRSRTPISSVQHSHQRSYYSLVHGRLRSTSLEHVWHTVALLQQDQLGE